MADRDPNIQADIYDMLERAFSKEQEISTCNIPTRRRSLEKDLGYLHGRLEVLRVYSQSGLGGLRQGVENLLVIADGTAHYEREFFKAVVKELMFISDLYPDRINDQMDIDDLCDFVEARSQERWPPIIG